MGPKRQPTRYRDVSLPHVPPSFYGRKHDGDDTLEELCDRWSNSIDLAKQTGLLYRLHAMLNA